LHRFRLGLAGLAVVAAGLFHAALPPAAAAPVQVAEAQTTPEQAAPAQTEDLLKPRYLGKPDAPITIIDYSSLTCPHCAHFHSDILPEIRKEYLDTGKAKLEFRDFPFDRAALHAAMLARCAPADRFYGLLDVLFKSQERWARASDPDSALAQTGRLAGVGQEQFDACMKNETLMNGLIQGRLDAEQKLGVDSTPTFFVTANGRQEKLVGAQPFEEFKKVIDKLGG
jgi:protein-disulfide isomerase